jgi:predicted nuclease of predicted toxin-antitoxin system
MRLLVDANLSPRVAIRLRDAGYETIHVGDVELLRASDMEIAAYAVAERRTVVSADSDFATMLAFNGQSAPSLVLLRSIDTLRPDEQAELLVANLPAVEAELVEGAVVSLSPAHLRVRRLPLRRRCSGDN